MPIYDINGNVISSGGSDSVISTEYIYNPIPIGAMTVGIINTSTGGVNPDSRYKVSGYIPVSSTVLYRAAKSNSTSNSYNTACYDSSKVFISAPTVSSVVTKHDKDGYSYYCMKFTFPEGTAYIRTSVYTDVSVNNIYLTTNNLPDPFDIYETRVAISSSNVPKIWTALGIPNLDFIKKFKGKKIICAGDSIVENNTTTNNHPWPSMIAEMLSATVYNDGQGGTGWAKGYYSAEARGCTCYRIENKWSSLYPAEPDIILVMGNMNDGTGGGAGYSELNPDWTGRTYMPVGTKDDADTTLSCYTITKRLILDLITAYPKAKIGIISSTPRSYNNTHFNNPQSYGHGWYESYITAHKYWCQEYNIPYLDLYHENPVLRPWISENAAEYYYDASTVDGYTTGVHPNEKGHLYGIAYPVIQWMFEWM